MASQLSRIASSPEICGGRPVIRNIRVRVSDIVDLLAAGDSREAIFADYPYLEAEDITAALEYASAAASHRVIASSRRSDIAFFGGCATSARSGAMDRRTGSRSPARVRLWL
jgi:uncharacterized protein (DUF433 family)